MAIITGPFSRFTINQGRRASVSVEFGLVGLVFIFLLLAVFELGTYYLRVAVLELAVQESSRQLLINNSASLPAPATPTIMSQTAFLSAIESNGFGLLKGEALHVLVQTNPPIASGGTGFGGITPNANLSTATGTTDSSGNVIVAYPASIAYGSDVLVQVAYDDNLIANMISPIIGQVGPLNQALKTVSASFAFQTEPQNTAQ